MTPAETPYARHMREQRHLSAHGRYPNRSGWWLALPALAVTVAGRLAGWW